MCVSRTRTIGSLLCLATIAVVARGDDTDIFTGKVAPLLEHKCLPCHSPGNSKGDISLATVDDLRENDYVVPGEPDASYLLDLVRTGEGGREPEMPKDGDPLGEDEVELLHQWIEDGTTWPDSVRLQERSKADKSWWSFQPLHDVQIPSPPHLPKAWSENAIDRFVFAKMREQGLQPSRPADKRTLIRRVTFDLTGLPPTPEEVQEFCSENDPQAYERLVDRLLDSPHYGECWGRHWLDVARFGESRGFERNEIVNNAWPFRDYVIRAFNEDKPFDDLIREHLAGDVKGKEDQDVEVGTTFLVCGPFDDVGNQDAAQAAQIRANTIDEIIRATGEAFLGLTIGCARCHNHKFDPIDQADYYGWYSIFAGVRHASRTVATAAAKQARKQELEPLTASQDRLSKEINELEQAVHGRGKERLAEFEQQWSRNAIDRTGTEERFAPTTAKFVRLSVEGTEQNPAARSGHRIDEFEVWSSEESPRNVALAKQGGQATGPSRVANDFAEAYSADLTIDGSFGARWIATGPELTITLAEPISIDRILFSSDRTGDADGHSVAAFVSEYRIETSRDGESWTEVASSRDRQPVNEQHRRRRLLDGKITADEKSRLSDLRRQLAAVKAKITAVPALPSWWVGEFSQPQETFHVFLGGDPQKKGPEVAPASLSALEGSVPSFRLADDATENDRRSSLADWIVHPQNPLTPRVLVNRIWQYHFGTGIVDTASDFGYMGGRPTHPALLDWLARQIQRDGWRIKPMHRAILLSQTYRQSSRLTDHPSVRPMDENDESPPSSSATMAPQKIDANSRYLWRFPPRRLTSEQIRDTALSIAGKLDKRMGGPGFRLYRYIQDNVATYIPLDEHGPDTYRRSVYHQNARASRVDLMTEFDCPDNSFSTPRRTSTTTPLQALTLMNHQFSLDMAAAFAERLRNETSVGDRPGQVRLAFGLAYSREPEEAELLAAVGLIEDHGLRAFCRAVLNSNELIFLE